MQRIKHLQRGLAFSILLALLSSCAMGPNYKRPEVNPPPNFRFEAVAATNSMGDLSWPEVFRDPLLQELISTALVNNYNLKQAVARVEQARYFALAARAPLFPQINYAGDIGRGRNAVFNGLAPFEDAVTRSSAQVSLNLFWEADLWGRIRRLSEAARAQYLSTDEARRGVLVTLVSDVATAYYQLVDLDREVEIQRAATNAYAGTYRLFNERRKNGVASALETDRAAASFNNAAATIPDLERQIAVTENQINILLGRNPGPIKRSNIAAQNELGFDIPAGLPSDLLRRRPDVLAAEQAVVAANANIGANMANFFPRIGLTALLGRASTELEAFTAGAANAWNIGGTLTGPLFQGGALRAQYLAAKAAFEEAKAAYQQTVITSFQDVSNALIARQKYIEQQVYLQQSVTVLQSAVQLATDRYMNGKSSYFEVLEAQQQLYPAQRAQVQNQVSGYFSVIQLYRALGGGWDAKPQ